MEASTVNLTTSAPALAGLPPLVPRAVLFGNAEREQPRLSPDGTMIAYGAPMNGVQSIWVRTIGSDDDRVVAHDPQRPIPGFLWRGDSRHVLYMQDRDGDENYHLFHVDLDGAPPRDLTPGDNVKVNVNSVDPRFPDVVLITSNQRDANVFDVVRLDLARGTTEIVAQNPGDVIGWVTDNALVVRAALAQLPDGSSVIRVRNDATSPWRTLDEFSFEDGTPHPLTFDAENRALYVISPKDVEAARLVRYDLATAEVTVVLADPHYDVTSVHIDPQSRAVVAASILRDRVEWIALDPAFAADITTLRTLHPGDIAISSTDGVSADGQTMIVHYTSDTGPVAHYAYDRRTHTGSLLFHERPSLLEHVLAPMQPCSFPARDGLMLHGYLTLPVGVEPRNLPTVLYVHGGPWHRDSWGYEPIVQWLANRGYAVLQVNFRGSTGYGKAFLNAGNREWAGAMRTDLLDARAWAVAQGYADPQRIAIFGGSYGGYAVLAALAFTPGVFQCGVDLVGPSNLTTFIDSIPSYWIPMRSLLDQRVGGDPAFLAAQSPVFRAADIRDPLLIVHGANDPRVKQAESDQIVAEMRANNVPVTYAVFEDEGHGFSQPANMLRFVAASEKFLSDNLAGRTQPPAPEESIDAFLR